MPDSPHPPTRSWPACIRTLAHWALPITTLALIPKCPACVVGYVLLFTGVGISLPTAAAARWTVIALSAGAIVLLTLRGTIRFVRRSRAVPRTIVHH